MSKVFVSYNLVDKDKVFPLVHKMESELGIKFWMDLNGIGGDEQFTNVIINAINECEVFLFMFSRAHEGINDASRDRTVREINFADMKRKRIVFVGLDGIKLPDWFLFNFPGKQVTQSNDNHAMENLAEDIRKWLELPRPESSPSPLGLANDESGRGTTMGKRRQEQSCDNALEESMVHETNGKSIMNGGVDGSVVRLLQRFGIPLVLLTVLAVIVIIVMNHNKDNTPNGVGELFCCPDDDHPHLIDLGLPSGTKWACCNVGASMPEASGGYYAWGETETKSTYTDDTYKYYQDGSYVDLGDDISGTDYDVAHVKWGGSWVMPTRGQQEELLNNCTYEWTTLNGVNGGKFTSKKNGRSIFLPAAGDRIVSEFMGASLYGSYRSSTQYPSDLGSAAYTLGFVSGNAYTPGDSRFSGVCVRPVSRN